MRQRRHSGPGRPLRRMPRRGSFFSARAEGHDHERRVPRQPRSSLINSAAYVIDCGDGVARQLVSANVPLPTVRHIFLTHQHSDHNADYGNLIWLAWTAGLRTRVDTWGPRRSRR